MGLRVRGRELFETLLYYCPTSNVPYLKAHTCIVVKLKYLEREVDAYLCTGAVKEENTAPPPPPRVHRRPGIRREDTVTLYCMEKT